MVGCGECGQGHCDAVMLLVYCAGSERDHSEGCEWEIEGVGD